MLPLALWIVIALVAGLLSGGLVNALADDLPKRRNLRAPHYPDDTPRPVSAWLGLSAFLAGQRSSPEGAKLSWRHPITEIATVALMLLTVFVTQDKGIGTVTTLFWLMFMAIYVLITVIDMEHKLILFAVINPALVLALIYAVVTETRNPPIPVDHLIGSAVGFGVFFLMYNGGFLFTYVVGKLRGQEIKEVAFGYGDVMLAGLSGMILGWQSLIFAMFITVFLGAFGAIAYLISRQIAGGKYSAFTALPYGPYIVAGTLAMLLFAQEIGGALMPW